MTNMKIASEVGCTVVVVGDSRIGKTSLIQRFVKNTFNQTYTPTSFDKSFGSQEVNKHTVHFSFWDTSGSPAYDSVRPLSYQEADVFLLCYKISDPISLYNIKNKWIRELRSHREDLPVVLCGCQADLRTDPTTLSHLGKTGRTPVTTEQALAICCEISAVNYIETSAKFPDDHGSNASSASTLAEAFELCALAAIKYKNSVNNNNLSKTLQKTKEPHIKRNDLSPCLEESNFKRSPSINSTMSLFTDSPQLNGGGSNNNIGGIATFKRSPSTNSNLSLAANVRLLTSPAPQTSTVRRGFTPFKGQGASPNESEYGFNDPRTVIKIGANLPPLQSPSFSECDSRLSTFSPEPLSDSGLPGPSNRRRVPNVIPPRAMMGKPPRRSTSGNCMTAIGGLNLNNVNLTKPYHRHSAIVSTSDFEARIPPMINENEAYHNFYQSSFQTFTPQSSCSELSNCLNDGVDNCEQAVLITESENLNGTENDVDSKTLTKTVTKDSDLQPGKICDRYSADRTQPQKIYDFGGGNQTVMRNEYSQPTKKETKPQRPTTLFKARTSYYKTTVIPSEPESNFANAYGFASTASYVTPTGDPQKRIFHQTKGNIPAASYHRSSLIHIAGRNVSNDINRNGLQPNRFHHRQPNQMKSDAGTSEAPFGQSTGMVRGRQNDSPSSDIMRKAVASNRALASSPSNEEGLSEATSSCFGQIRPNCLSRRTSYRTHQKVSIPVAAPMSPIDGNMLSSGRGSECSFEIKSPSQQSVGSTNSSSSCCVSPLGTGMQSHIPRMMMKRYPTLPEDESCSENGSVQGEFNPRDMPYNINNNRTGRMNIFDQPLKPYESLKSQISTSSQGSTGSKMTSSSSNSSDKSSISRGCMPSREIIDPTNAIQLADNVSKVGYHPPHHHGNKMFPTTSSQPISIDTNQCDESLQEETMKGLSFVSPKSGVYRPMSDGRKHRQNCIVM